VREAVQSEREVNVHNFKSIKRESDKLKERLGVMGRERRELLEKLRVHQR
jgi:hypothetical protein